MVDEKLKKRALRYYHRCHNMAKTLRKYPYCSRSVFYTWLKNEGKERAGDGRPGVLPTAGHATAEAKAGIVARIAEGHEPIMDVAIETGYGRPTLYKWLRQCRSDGIIGLMGKEKNKAQESGIGVERRAFQKAGRDANADRHPDGDDERPKKRPAHQPKAAEGKGKGSDS